MLRWGVMLVLVFASSVSAQRGEFQRDEPQLAEARELPPAERARSREFFRSQLPPTRIPVGARPYTLPPHVPRAEPAYRRPPEPDLPRPGRERRFALVPGAAIGGLAFLLFSFAGYRIRRWRQAR